MAVSKRAKALYWGIFDGIETSVANIISNYQQRKLLNKYLKSKPPQYYCNSVHDYWKRWKTISPKWGWYYASQNGIEDPRYIPNDLYYTIIDQHFNKRKLGYGFNDKNYYSRLFPDVRQPKVVVRKIGDIFLDNAFNLITEEEAYSFIMQETEVVCKPSLDSGSGQGIVFWETMSKQDEIMRYLQDRKQKDYIIQPVICQHSELKKIHSSSINTLRIVSLLMPEAVYILSSILRMGVGDGRIDNVSAGGISCGINPDGTLKEFATSCYTGEKYEVHPQGFRFKGFLVPSYDKAIEIVKHIHPYIPHFRLVSWDIAIDIDGMPLLIEANMRKGGIGSSQFNNGPLFGDLTDRVLDEVFKKR